ncbi:MAG: TonB-dependent receptor [Curvibacter sp.]|nr:MAG: TonB-dependent receptor [Curvibacter sp.]
MNTLRPPPTPHQADRPRRLNVLASALCALGFQSLAWATDTVEVAQLSTVDVVSSTPIDGIGVPLTQFPANAQKITGPEAATLDASNLADLLNHSLGSVSVSNGSGSPYQSDVNYRGFQASSLLGAPVGLSVYFDGVRVNEPFGSIVNWDLIPMNAIAGVDVLPGSNPLFGLNTLGGALVVNTKNGKDNAGSSITAQGGSFQRKALRFETGWADETLGTDHFIAGNWDRQAGFRSHSSSEVRQLFGKTSWQGNGGKTRLALSLTAADTVLNGTQALPMDMMANPAAAYTWPDSTANQLFMANLKGSHWLSDEQQLSGQFYLRQGRSRNVNSNAELDDGCLNDDGSLAQSGGSPKCSNKAPSGTATNAVTSAAAQALGFARWTSSINTSVVDSQTRQRAWGGSVQWTDFQQRLGRDNTLQIGASWDSARITYDQTRTLARLLDYQTVPTPNQTYGFTADGKAPSASNPLSFTGSNVLGSVNLASTTHQLSTYLSNTWQASERLSLSAAGSFNATVLNQNGVSNQYLNDDGGYSWTDPVSGISYYNPAYLGAYQYSNSTASGVKGSANGIPAGAVAGPESHSLFGKHHYQRFNPSFGFNYQLDRSTGLFGQYSEAMRAPTSIELSCADPKSPCALPTGFNGDPDLQPVVAKTVELGARGSFGPQGHWTAAVYDTRLSNDIQFIATSSSLGYFANVGNTERRGLELGAQTRLKDLSLAANYGWVDASYRSAFTTASGQHVTSGNRIPGIARQTLKLRAAWQASPSLLLGSQLILAGSQVAHGNESNQTPGGTVPGYGVLHLDAHWRLSPELQLNAQLSNALNKPYATYGMSGLRSVYTLASQQFVTPAAPRALWVSLTYTFGGDAKR